MVVYGPVESGRKSGASSDVLVPELLADPVDVGSRGEREARERVTELVERARTPLDVRQTWEDL